MKHEFLPQSWNNGIVERWNSGFSKDIIHFKLYRPDEFCHLPNIAVSSPSRRLYEPEAKTHFSNIPAFHHSNWGEAPNLKYQGVNLVGVAVWVPYRQYFGIWSAKKLPLALDELP